MGSFLPQIKDPIKLIEKNREYLLKIKKAQQSSNKKEASKVYKKRRG